MSEFLKLLNLELQMTDPHSDLAPKDKPKRSDRIVSGEVPEDIKKLWILSRSMMEEFAVRYVKLEMAGGTATEDQTSPIAELKDKADFIRELFWISLKDHFKLWGKESIGIRENWTVVYKERSVDDDIRDFLRRLME